jgi:hypothetical protein
MIYSKTTFDGVYHHCANTAKKGVDTPVEVEREEPQEEFIKEKEFKV